MTTMTRYLIDILMAPLSVTGSRERLWIGTYATKKEAETAFSELADRPEILAANLVEWKSGTLKKYELKTGSWGSRNVMGGDPSETVLLHGDRTYLCADSGWYSLPDWRVTSPNISLAFGCRLAARKVLPDSIFAIKKHPRVFHRDFYRNLHLLGQNPAFPVL